MANRSKPTQLHVVEGTFRKGRHAGKGLEFDFSIPEKPDWLGKNAAAEWDRILPILEEQGLISAADQAALAQYCELYGEFKRCPEKFLAAQHNQLRMVMADLGLNPSSRAKLPKKQKPGDNPFTGTDRPPVKPKAKTKPRKRKA